MSDTQNTSRELRAHLIRRASVELAAADYGKAEVFGVTVRKAASGCSIQPFAYWVDGAEDFYTSPMKAASVAERLASRYAGARP